MQDKVKKSSTSHLCHLLDKGLSQLQGQSDTLWGYCDHQELLSVAEPKSIALYLPEWILVLATQKVSSTFPRTTLKILLQAESTVLQETCFSSFQWACCSLTWIYFKWAKSNFLLFSLCAVLSGLVTGTFPKGVAGIALTFFFFQLLWHYRKTENCLPVIFLAIMCHDLISREMGESRLGKPSSNPGSVTSKSVSKLCHLSKSDFLFHKALPQRATVMIQKV